MEPDANAIVALVQPYFTGLITDVETAFNEFDTHGPLEYRLSIEDARPKVLSERVSSLWTLRHGSSNSSPVRMAVDAHRMAYLFIEGDEFSVGLRFKKLNDCGQSYQHVSGRQTTLRAQNSFPEFHAHVAQVFFGYRYTDGADELVPALIDMSLSAEYVTANGEYDVRWRQVIWNAGQGVQTIQPFPPPLFPPAPPVVRPRRTAEGEGQGNAQVGG